MTDAPELEELGLLTAALLHELAQPLFAIQGTLQLAHQVGEGLNGEQVKVLLEQARYLDALVDHYGRFSGHRRVERVALDQSVLRSAPLWSLKASNRDIDVRMNLSTAYVQWRSEAACQVVLNLVRNAMQAVTGQPNRQIAVETFVAGGLAGLRVSDSGPGVSEAAAASLGQPFNSTKSPTDGRGLGLYVTRKLVEEASGVLSVRREEGLTHFEVIMPESD